MEGARKSVLLIGNHLSKVTGTRGVCEELTLRLRARGWQVITASDKYNRLLRILDMIYTAWHYRRSYTVASVEIYSGAAFIWAEAVCFILRCAGKPYVLTLYGGNLPDFARRWPRRVRRLLRSASAVTSPSRYFQEQLKPYCDDIGIMPYGIDLDQYVYRLRANPRPHLVWLRAFHQLYNPSLIPSMLTHLLTDFPDLKIIMVGPDKGDGSLQKMQQKAVELGVADRIETAGAIPKSAVPDVLQQSDIFINTTNADGMPVSVIEAMACGLCVVSTNVGGLPYLLQQDHDALLVPPEEPERMAAAVRSILTESSLAEKLSRNARQTAKQFEWPVVLLVWEKLLTGLAARGQAGNESLPKPKEHPA